MSWKTAFAIKQKKNLEKLQEGFAPGENKFMIYVCGENQNQSW